jgi:hypothetical protein
MLELLPPRIPSTKNAGEDVGIKDPHTLLVGM